MATIEVLAADLGEDHIGKEVYFNAVEDGSSSVTCQIANVVLTGVVQSVGAHGVAYSPRQNVYLRPQSSNYTSVFLQFTPKQATAFDGGVPVDQYFLGSEIVNADTSVFVDMP